MKNNNLFSVLIVSISTFIMWILWYLYHPIMIRYLSLQEFAEFESLNWIINILGVIVTAISLFMVKEFSKDKENEKILSLTHIFWRSCFFIWITTFFVYLLFTPIISSFLKIDNYFIIIFTWFSVFLAFITVYQHTLFQAKWYFKLLSFISIFNASVRLIIWFLLVYSWFKVFWAVWGFIFSQIIVFILSYTFLNKILKNYWWKARNIDLEKEIKIDFLKQKKQLFHFLYSAIILALFMNIDVLFAKHFFDSETAWVYAWISTIAKFLVFVGMSIETVYFPVLTSENKLNKKNFSVLSILYVIMTFWALWFFYLFWEPTLHLFKPWFEEHLPLLYLIIIYCWVLSLINFLVKILIAFNKYFINWILTFALAVFIWFLYLFNDDSIYTFANLFNWFIAISLVLSYIYFYFVKHEK